MYYANQIPILLTHPRFSAARPCPRSRGGRSPEPGGRVTCNAVVRGEWTRFSRCRLLLKGVLRHSSFATRGQAFRETFFRRSGLCAAPCLAKYSAWPDHQRHGNEPYGAYFSVSGMVSRAERTG